jgi:hypothetical protein
MLTLTIDQIKLELDWLDKLKQESAHRAGARHPQLVQS